MTSFENTPFGNQNLIKLLTLIGIVTAHFSLHCPGAFAVPGGLPLLQEKATPIENQDIPTPSVPNKSELDLLLLIQTSQEITPELINQTFREASEYQRHNKLYSYPANEVNVQPIPANQFQILEEMLGANIRSPSTEITDGIVTRNANQTNGWNVSLTALGDAEIESIEIRSSVGNDLKNAKENEKIEKHELSASGSGKRFTYHNPTIAALVLPDGQSPVEYRLLSKNGPSNAFRPWPQPVNNFFAKLPKFQGGEAGRDQLLEVLRAGRTAATFYGLPIDRTVLLSYAKIGIEGRKPLHAVIRNNLLVRFGKHNVEYVPENEKGPAEGPARVWSMFALTSAEKDEVLEALKKLPPQDPLAVAKFIRGENLDGKGTYPLVWHTGKVVIPVSELSDDWVYVDIELTPDDFKPKWFEIPIKDDSREYLRAFQIKDPNAWPADRRKGSWIISIYETQYPVIGKKFGYGALKLDEGAAVDSTQSNYPFWRVLPFGQWPEGN